VSVCVYDIPAEEKDKAIAIKAMLMQALNKNS